jgi:hypothetical protein
MYPRQNGKKEVWKRRNKDGLISHEMNVLLLLAPREKPIRDLRKPGSPSLLLTSLMLLLLLLAITFLVAFISKYPAHINGPCLP